MTNNLFEMARNEIAFDFDDLIYIPQNLQKDIVYEIQVFLVNSRESIFSRSNLLCFYRI